MPERVTSAQHRAWNLQDTAMDPFYSFPAGGSPLASEVHTTWSKPVAWQLPETCLLL